MMFMKVCSSCGEHLADDSRFCSNCGAVLDNTQPLGGFEPESLSAAPPVNLTEPGESPPPIAAQPPVQQGMPLAVAEAATPSVAEANAPQAPKGKKAPHKKLLAAVCAVAVVAAGVIGFLLASGKSPDKMVRTAYQNTNMSIGNQTRSISNAMGLAYLQEDSDKKLRLNLSVDLSETLRSYYEEYYGFDYGEAGTWFSAVLEHDPDKGLTWLDFQNSMKFDFEASLTRDAMAVYMPGVFDKPVSIVFDTFVDAWNESELGKDDPIDKAEFDALISLFRNPAEAPDAEEFERLLNEAYAAMMETAEYAKPVERRPAGSSEEMDMVLITVPDDTVNEFIMDVLQIYDDYMRQTYAYAEEALSQFDYSYESYYSMFGFNSYEEMESAVKELNISDVEAEVYIDDDEYVRLCSLSFQMRPDGEKVGVTAYVGCHDGEDPFAEWYGAVIMDFDGQRESLEFEGSREYSSDSGYDVDFSLIMIDEYGYSEDFGMRISWNPALNRDNLKLSLFSGNEDLEIILEGTYLVDTGSTLIAISQFSMDDGYDTYEIPFDITLTIEEASRPIGSDLSEGAVELPELTWEDLAEIGDNIETLFYSLYY